MIILVLLVILFCIIGGYLAGIALLLSYIRNRWWDWRWSGRLAAACISSVLIFSPFLAYKGAERRYVLARVPKPMHAMWIEYRLEKSWGIPFFGMPGDNETGFVIYRMTDGSARWARNKGAHLGDHLAGGTRDWRPTPVADEDPASSRWHSSREPRPVHHPLNFREYLGRYGFDIPAEQNRIDEANRAIRNPGSFYSYGRGGSITVVDPAHGKVFFAYAG